jgi:anti-anti-sigma factor
MFEISMSNNEKVLLTGRLDASQVEKADAVLQKVSKSCVIDFTELDYISSAGLGILIALRKRLGSNGHTVKITNMNKHIQDVFRYAGMDKIFEIE